MNATSIDGASTATAAFAKIRFKGQIADRLGRKGLRRARVAVKFVPATGRATTVTERGPTDRPKARRRGSKGFFGVARDRRGLNVLAKGLPTPA